jgi:hypothetical protein
MELEHSYNSTKPSPPSWSHHLHASKVKCVDDEKKIKGIMYISLHKPIIQNSIDGKEPPYPPTSKRQEL